MLPWQDIMSSAMGILRWSPAQYNDATFYEFTAAMRGYLTSKGADFETPVTRDEFLNMVEKDKKRIGNGN